MNALNLSRMQRYKGLNERYESRQFINYNS